MADTDYKTDSKLLLEDVFLREKPAKIIMGLKTAKDSVYATILSKHADCTYSHTIKILNAFRDMGIVQFEKSGRIKRVRLTDNGWDIAHNLEAILKKFSQINESVAKGEAREKKSARKKSDKPGKEAPAAKEK